jgi:hypothetical protein
MDLIVISFKSNTRQGGHLGRVLFALVHFCAFCPIVVTHPTCVFPSLAYDTHIVGTTLDVLLIFLRLQEEFDTLKLLVQLTKCVT